MKVNYGFRTKNTGPIGTGPGGTRILSLGRVVDIILDNTHPSYLEKGGSQGLYGVFYTTFGELVDETLDRSFAFCNLQGFRRLPVVNEIVRLELLTSVEGQEINPKATTMYWTEIVSVWNHPHHNIAPDPAIANKKGINLGPFVERDTINPLQLVAGDVVMEGRFGQSIRMGGSKLDLDNIKSNSEDDSYTLIRNGQGVTSTTPYNTVLEDINEDPTSIYLASNHRVKLKEPVKIKRDSWINPPIEYSKYMGGQMILTADRVICNAKKEHLLLSAKEGIGLMATTLALDAHKTIGLDANKIYIGKKAKEESEPVLLGNSTTEWLRDLLSTLNMLIQVMGTSPSLPEIWVPTVATMATSLEQLTQALDRRLKSLESSKIFVE